MVAFEAAGKGFMDYEEEKVHEPDEQTQAEMDAIREWIRDNLPREFVSVTNLEKYAKAQAAIETIIRVVNSCTDEEYRPKYEIGYQVLGTILTFTLKLKFDLALKIKHIREIVSALPDDCDVLFLPQKGYKASLVFSFYYVKEILDDF